ncbi:hypothetical protein [Thermohalobacter berrensis]|uniref:hypothetical protein n=1 Tax=Thermohalobacter berrensis TaxID=99594 RepID=UPI0011C45318|nr:hypothetical protein [Thermohalobacter berrensis]
MENIMNQAKSIKQNNFNNMQQINSINLILTSDNNGRDKDPNISEGFLKLKRKIEEVNNATEEFLSILNNDNAESRH